MSIIYSRKLEVNPLCPFICKKKEESVCKRAKTIWDLCLPSWQSVHRPNMRFRRSFWDSISSNVQLGERDLTRLICWYIWNDRNNQIHHKQIPSIEIKCEWIHSYLAYLRRVSYKQKTDVTKYNDQQGDKSSITKLDETEYGCSCF